MKIELIEDSGLTMLLNHKDSAIAMRAFAELLRRRDVIVGTLGLDAYARARAKGYDTVCWECGSLDELYMCEDAEWGVCHEHRVRWIAGESHLARMYPGAWDEDEIEAWKVRMARKNVDFPEDYDEVPPVCVADGDSVILDCVRRLLELRPKICSSHRTPQTANTSGQSADSEGDF